MFSRNALGVCCVAVMSVALPVKQAMAEQCGKASWYHEGSRTASGERYRPDGITAAHKTLPLGSIVQVTHQRTGRTVTVRINDRGPFIRGRIIDLSRGAKRVLGMDGLAPVCIAVLERGKGRTRVAKSDWSLFGSDGRAEQPRANRHGRRSTQMASLDGDHKTTRPHSRHRADLASADGDHATSRRHSRRHLARVTRLDRDSAESRRNSRRYRVARAEVDSDDEVSETRSDRRSRRHAHVRSRAHSHTYGYRSPLAGWPGGDWSEM